MIHRECSAANGQRLHKNHEPGESAEGKTFVKREENLKNLSKRSLAAFISPFRSFIESVNLSPESLRWWKSGRVREPAVRNNGQRAIPKRSSAQLLMKWKGPVLHDWMSSQTEILLTSGRERERERRLTRRPAPDSFSHEMNWNTKCHLKITGYRLTKGMDHWPKSANNLHTKQSSW